MSIFVTLVSRYREETARGRLLVNTVSCLVSFSLRMNIFTGAFRGSNGPKKTIDLALPAAQQCGEKDWSVVGPRRLAEGLAEFRRALIARAVPPRYGPRAFCGP